MILRKLIEKSFLESDLLYVIICNEKLINTFLTSNYFNKQSHIFKPLRRKQC